MIEFDRGWTFSGVERVEVRDVSSRRKLHLTSSKLDAKKVPRFLFPKLSLTKYQTSLCSEWALCPLKRKSWFAKNSFEPLSGLSGSRKQSREETDWMKFDATIHFSFLWKQPIWKIIHVIVVVVVIVLVIKKITQVKLLKFYPDPFPASSCFSSEIVFLGRNQPRFNADAQFISLLQKCENNTNENFEF